MRDVQIDRLAPRIENLGTIMVVESAEQSMKLAVPNSALDAW
ncbi:hypothetical protein I551_8617 [Mycobacterium ulcerans str. Harvey]|uniref:Uncharacterized protein n=1 Tax=Mycobacterium ulcerans str. Harvey TaxID=1299332 RepID=A0ABN0RAC0_MYCUL|nr:hypothetical protein I551_8617 [Mycobacterium ulcerans str. Harvey]